MRWGGSLAYPHLPTSCVLVLDSAENSLSNMAYQQRFSLKTILHFTISLLVIGNGWLQLTAEDLRNRTHTENLTVMVRASFAESDIPEYGTGIVVGRKLSTLYILTAAHVIRKPGLGLARAIDVGFRWLNPRNDVTNTVRASFYRAEDDVAVISVELSARNSPAEDSLLFAALGDPARLEHEEGVRPLGYPRGNAWSTCLSPDSFDKLTGNTIEFESKCIQPGHSGGPLVDEDWKIIGMVQQDWQPHGKAIAISYPLALVNKWGVPVNLESDNSSDTNLFLKISVGSLAACGITQRDRVACWGENYSGLLGVGSDGEMKADAGLLVADRHRFSDVSVGYSHACAISTGGEAFCWGKTSNYLDYAGSPGLGDGSPRSSTKPIPVAGDLRFSAITTGSGHTCAIQRVQLAREELATNQGPGYCWGYNASGELGNGTKMDSSVPVPISGSLVWSQLVAGPGLTCGLTVTHDSYCWGHAFREDDKQLLIPQRVNAVSFSWISLGGPDRDRVRICGIGTDDGAYCWGPGLKSPIIGPPQRMSSEFRFRTISVGEDRTCGTTVEKRVVCWDYSGDKAAAIAGLSDAETVNVGSVACAVRAGGIAWCWGGSGALLGSGLGSYGMRESETPDFQVRISRCKGSFLGELPAAAGDDVDFLSVSEPDFLQQIGSGLYLAGLGSPRQPNVEKVLQNLRNTEDTLEITERAVLKAKRSMHARVRTCEVDPDKDPQVRLLRQLATIESQIEDITRNLQYSDVQIGSDAQPIIDLDKLSEHAQQLTMTAKRYSDLAAALRISE
jgi:Trypsin-like peptidase domain/Regulator of chromosome condensation (RCC1) repeat